MLPLGIIRRYYPDLSVDELKEIQEIVYLMACAVVQHIYGSKWMGDFEDSKQEEK